MAGDYGLDSGGNVVIQTPAATGRGPATKITGGGSSFSGYGQASQAPGGNFGAMGETTLKTIDALDKLTDGLLKPVIAREQKRQYFEGMSEVAQGKSLLEVQKDRPWYTEIFGPSATVQGAQAMTLMSALDTAKAEFTQQMPELRQQPPDAVRKYLVDQASSIAATGDPTMDAMVQAKLAEQWGPMMDLHMKQHISYVQEKNVNAFENTLVTRGDEYQQDIGTGTAFFSQEYMDLAKQRAVETFQPIPGMSDDAWSKATTAGLQANLMKGNFGIYEAFKESDQWAKLPLDTRTQLERLHPYAVQWNLAHAPMFRQDMTDATGLNVALSQGTGPTSLDDLHAWVDQQNTAWTNKTGSSKPKFDNKDVAQMEKNWYQGQEFLASRRQAAMEAQAKAAGEGVDATFQQSTLLDALNSGSINPVAMNMLDDNIAQQTFVDVRKKLEGNPEGMKQWLHKLAVGAEWGRKTMDHQLADNLTVQANNFFVQGTPITDEMRESLGYMQGLAGGPNGLSGLSKYVGADNAAKMTALIKSGVDLSDRSAVDAARQSINTSMDAPVTIADKKEVLAYLEDQDPGFIKRNIPVFGPGGLSGYNLNEDSLRRMTNDLAPQMTRYMGIGMSREDAMALAFTQQFGNSSNVDFVDGAYVPASFASNGNGLFATVSGRVGGMSQLSEDYQLAVKNVINGNMALAVGKVPLDPDTDLTKADRLANSLSRTTNNIVDAIPFVGPSLGKPFDATGRAVTDPTKFYPEDYKTIGGMSIGGGVIQVTRVPKSSSSGMRTYNVTITADQVIAELDLIRKANAEKARKGVGYLADQERLLKDTADQLFNQ